MTDDFRKLCLPYCIRLRKDGKWLVLNRYYQVIGDPTREHSPDVVDWKDCRGIPFTVWKLRRALDKVAVEHRAEVDGESWWLYCDGSIPTDGAANWAAYSARLLALAKMKRLLSLK